MAGPFSRDGRRRALRRLRRTDVLTTREGLVVDLAGTERTRAIRDLAGDESREVELALVDVLADPLDEVRAEAVAALHARGSDDGVARCAAVAAGWDPARFPVSRGRAWLFLADCVRPEDGPRLAEALLLAERTPGIEPRALEALDRATEDATVRRDVLARVLQHLDHEHPAVVGRARELTVHLGREEPAIVAGVLHDSRRAAVAVSALGEIGDLAYTGAIAALLAPGHAPGVRAAAATALGALGGHRAARQLVGVVDDADPVVRRAATDALAPLAGLLGVTELPEPDDDGGGPEVAAPPAGDDVGPEEIEADLHPDADVFPSAVEAGRSDRDDQPTPLRDARPVMVARPVPVPRPGRMRGGAAVARYQIASDAPAAEIAPAPEADPAPEEDAADARAEAQVALIEPEQEPDREPEAEAKAQVEAVAEQPVIDATPAAAAAPAPLVADATEDGEDVEYVDEREARWNRAHPPVPDGPPPRPRGARKPVPRRR